MSRELLFVCSFPNGTAARVHVDLRELYNVPKGVAFSPRFEYHGDDLPPANELEEWAKATFADLADRARCGFAALTPLGILWRFAPGKKPRKVEVTPSQAIETATITRGAAWQKVTFANGGRGVWKADLGATPVCIGITIFGPLPGGEEIRAWLFPLLVIPGARETFKCWSPQFAYSASGPVKIEFTHSPL